ncbi:MAG: protease pro-enzyme activation domain-containing protein [Solirubrobacteraceae bacterium]
MSRSHAPKAQAPGQEQAGVQVWLAPAMAAAARFAMTISTPGSPQFRHFLTPDDYTARFGPTIAEASQVRSWLRSRGFTDVRADAQRDYIQASAPADRIKAVFPTNAGQLTVPRELSPEILAVTNSYYTGASPGRSSRSSRSRDSRSCRQSGSCGSTPVRAESSSLSEAATCSHYWGQHEVAGLPEKFGATTFSTSACPYTGQQLRKVYGTNLVNTGRGQTIAISLPGGLEPQMFQTLQRFAAENHLPAPSHTRYKQINLQPSFCTTHDNSRGEEQMDIEAAYAMDAPGAAGELARAVKQADMLDNLHRCARARDVAMAQYADALARLWATGQPRVLGPETTNTAPITIKGVCLDVGGRALLGRNDRGEWELPGGRPAVGESFPACLVREVAEETGLEITVSDLISAGPFEVIPGRCVNAVIYSCDVINDAQPARGHEHNSVAFLDPARLTLGELPDVYRRAIDAQLKRRG